MDKMNTIGNDIVTHYGPELPIKAVLFIDDDTGTGGITTADNTINNCGIIEDKKMMTFNNQGEKTKKEIMTLTAEVERGRIERVPCHKIVDTWFD